MNFPTALDGGLLVVAYYASDAGGRLIYSNQTETHKQQEVVKIVFFKTKELEKKESKTKKRCDERTDDILRKQRQPVSMSS